MAKGPRHQRKKQRKRGLAKGGSPPGSGRWWNRRSHLEVASSGYRDRWRW